MQKRENSETTRIEYYVHYRECELATDIYIYLKFLVSFVLVNRRMDEWVSIERIDLLSGPVEEPAKELDAMLDLNGRERKVTRNLKRKHDEINHVQKVLSP